MSSRGAEWQAAVFRRVGAAWQDDSGLASRWRGGTEEPSGYGILRIESQLRSHGQKILPHMLHDLRFLGVGGSVHEDIGRYSEPLGFFACWVSALSVCDV
nr:MAG: hypothetical protein [Chiromantes dehaani nimavirus]